MLLALPVVSHRRLLSLRYRAVRTLSLAVIHHQTISLTCVHLSFVRSDFIVPCDECRELVLTG